MSLNDVLTTDVSGILSAQWTKRNGQVVPETSDVGLGNDAVLLQGTVLYADLAESTKLVNTRMAHYAAEIYKSYLHCASRIIRANGGIITAFDGDRVMAVFIGDGKDSAAVRTALNINYAVEHIINPAVKRQYPNSAYVLQQAVGIDTSELWVARTGIRGSNDLVWVGRAANYAAKLCSLRSQGYPSWITKDVYDLLDDAKKYGKDGRAMWEQRVWSEYSTTVYRSSWWWGV